VFKTFVFGLVSICVCRLVILFGIKIYDNYKIDGAGLAGTVTLYLNNVVSGGFWGASLIWLSHSMVSVSFDKSLFPLIIAGLLAASLAGSALQAKLFAAFAIPCVSLLLVYSAYTQPFETTSVWLFLACASLLSLWVSSRLENVLSRYRVLSRQNTTLLQDLATAKQQAEANRKTIEKANDALKEEVIERKTAERKIRNSERETARILQDMQETYFQVNGQGEIVRISPSVQYLMGCSESEVVGTRFSALFAKPQYYKQFINSLRDSVNMVQNHETCLCHRFNQDIWVSINAHASYGQLDALEGFEGTIRDITVNKLAADALHQEKERLHVTLESIGDGVITTDVNRKVEFLNPVAEWMTGWSEENAHGKPITTVFKLVDENTNRPVALPLKKWLEEGQRSELGNPVVLLNKKQERTYSIELKGSPISDLKGKVIGTVLVFRNVSKLHTLTKQLTYQASHDSLTGLINRKEFESRVKHAINSAQKDGKTHALCYVDLDQFKIVNDTSGHHAGDELLIQLTARLKDALRESDTLARLGGDEFGVLLVGCPLDRAKQVAENIRHLVEKFRFIWEDRVFRVGASIGLVAITPKTTDLVELLSAADSACYVAKESGRNQVHVYRPNDRAIADRQGQMQWTHRIQSALEQNRFELHIQSIVPVQDISSPMFSGEILIRMVENSTHGEKKLITPNAFIPAAERYQLMRKIDQWVVVNALEVLQKLQYGVTQWGMCCINLSGQSIGDQKILDIIVSTLKSTKIPPSILCFEITESAVIANLENAHQFINTLNTMGCRFALDDFGAGLSSYAYLKNLPVDFLKLDGELVKDAATDKASYAMVDAINHVAHVLGMQTIAEHVESEETLQALQRIGVDYAQGFGIEPPVSIKWASLPMTKAS
jgi:diguanylate cyclase (GGDEF)-like protein/PAS domain S-box-containing protein